MPAIRANNAAVFYHSTLTDERKVIKHLRIWGGTNEVMAVMYVRSPEMQTHLCWSLTHGGRVTDIFVGEWPIIGSESQRQAIVWTNAGMLLIGPQETNFNSI